MVADLDGSTQDSRIFLAAPIGLAEIEELFAERIVDEEAVQWSEREGAVLARRRRRLGALLLEDKPLAPARCRQAEGGDGRRHPPDGIGRAGLVGRPHPNGASASPSCAGGTRAGPTCPTRPCSPPSTAGWRRFSTGISRRGHLPRIDLAAALKALVPWDKQRELDRLAPTHIEVPSGSRVPIDYADPAEPTLSVACRRCSVSSIRRGSAAARCRSPSICCRRRAGRCR